ncbi:MAG: tetratricopeptide repeat protein [Leptolyngbyaceae cyanobacterium CSU_1_3]|nr:tetratricopeptide repeat protein [Leptolyngbyaceae cyanobacterium CSU_1_3]
MIDQIAAAFDRQDYRVAAKLLKEFLHDSPQDPAQNLWGQFYRARLYEVSGKLESAREIYRHLLRDGSNPKLANQSRQGLQRLDEQEHADRKQAIAQATAQPESTEPGVLILESMPSETRTAAAQALARVLKLDPYTARMQIPQRGWRLYRVGAIGELQLYGQQIRAAKIPAFWASLDALQKLPVFQVHSIQAYQPGAIVLCENEQGQLGSLNFDWSEVCQRVEGRLPIFERVVDTDIRRGTTERQRRETTQDYAHLCDLHLPKRRCILRICDLNYQFQQGIAFSAPAGDSIALDQATNRIHWNNLLAFLNYQLPQQPVWSEFQAFSETAIDQPLLFKRFKSHVRLFGQDTSPWNPTFHLYSGLAFLKSFADA